MLTFSDLTTESTVLLETVTAELLGFTQGFKVAWQGLCSNPPKRGQQQECPRPLGAMQGCVVQPLNAFPFPRLLLQLGSGKLGR